MLASSKHLILASSVFKAMLQAGRFLEGNTLASQKQVEIPLPDDNAAAFEILLNILHGRTRKVPKKVDLSLLVELSVLVDKYQLHEPVEIFSDLWFDHIDDIADWHAGGAHVPKLICITWVFNKATCFSKITRTAQLKGCKPLKGSDTDALPIPGPVIGIYSTIVSFRIIH